MAETKEQKRARIAAETAALPPVGPLAGSPGITICEAPNTGEQVPTRYRVQGQVTYPAGKGVGPASVYAKNGAVRSEVERRAHEGKPAPTFSADADGHPMIDGALVPTPYVSGADPFE